MGFKDYLQRFEKTPIKFLADARHAPRAHNDGQTVERSFALAIEQASRLHQKAEPLIFHAALLAPEPIPLFLLDELWGRLEPQPLPSLRGGEADAAIQESREAPGLLRHSVPRNDGEEAADAREDLEEAIAALRAFALVDRALEALGRDGEAGALRARFGL